jgi:hypothetical protein
MDMIEEVFARLEERFQVDQVTQKLVYYFSVDEVRKTVTLSPEGVLVENGKTVEVADCVCKTNAAFFIKIWEENYRPGMQDFLSGAIKSNNPFALQTFLKAFGEQG